ncbi:UDP-N-acetylmuramoyl-L-alanyl-D-glutamate--2,6-diaminopimelate ligase [Pontiella sulfatireligans]|uniref:UDP-N-acetylmuramoyl-L-alanyl-D-glutamate--2,6-diaminopimelate ligase n=1 Tax=Pontiella sulfatireligans TaxID=2750658 RepID=A0A6C2UHL2_9BACT|nr:UDP-N-acetylmuramoyl-L-alanyl-D-glutamate--2,6-diaminopimelate ligase [Pontiella sulfatireligans]VGO19680.1 UDP-N-acetylmuramoyl-L-alanyl-D-glutamate--2,6-diaminopimelate ligase [Pontiella sulfatireligans]
MKLTQLLENVTTLDVKGSTEVEVGGLAYDSREVKLGWLFVAVAGHQVDGTEFITQALSNGAAVVVSENDLDLGAGAVHVQVPRARRALAEIANAYYGDLSRRMTVVGVTGTNGKTTTTYMIRDLLRDGGFLPGLIGTVAYEIGERSIPASRTTPEAPDLHAMFRQMKEAGCDAAVMEVSSHAIAQQRVHGIDFNISVFTNLTHDHLDYHKDMDSYFNVKAELFQMMERRHDRSAVINIDDPWGRKMLEDRKFDAEVVTYGFSQEAMVSASNAKVNVKGTNFNVSTPWGKARIHMQLLGRFNIHNTLAALAVGGLCGIDLQRMIRTLEAVASIPGRLELVANRKHKRVFVDYAHTDDALKNVLSTLREICKGKLYVVFGCGGNRDRGKRSKMGRMASELADYSIITSDNPRNEEPGAIVSEIIEGFAGQDRFEVVLDRREAIEKGLQKTGRKDILLIAGKGHETYQEANGTIVPFDDRETVREIIG